MSNLFSRARAAASITDVGELRLVIEQIATEYEALQAAYNELAEAAEDDNDRMLAMSARLDAIQAVACG